MIKREDVYKIGLFNKPHGIHGELSFTFTDDIFDRADCDYLICRLDDIFVPFFIEEYRFRSDSTALVKLEGVDTAERARMFTNVEVSGETCRRSRSRGVVLGFLCRIPGGRCPSRCFGRGDGCGYVYR